MDYDQWNTRGGMTSMAPSGASQPRPGGMGGLELGLGAAGLGMMALPALFGNRQQPRPGPFQMGPEMTAQLGHLDSLVSQFGSPEATVRASQPLMPGVTSLARQEMAAQGLEGPLAASMVNAAQSRLLGQLEQQRLGNLQQALAMRQDLSQQAARAREAYAQQVAQARQAAAQRARGERQGLFSMGGALLGLPLMALTGGLVNPAMTAGLATGLEGLGNSLGLFNDDPYGG